MPLNQVQAFFKEHEKMAYDDATNEAFWKKCQQTCSEKIQDREGMHYIFEDGSVIERDGLGAVRIMDKYESNVAQRLKSYRDEVKNQTSVVQSVKNAVKSWF